MAKRKKALKSKDESEAMPKAALRSDLLDKSPLRRRVASPVTAPLTFRRPIVPIHGVASGQTVEERARAEVKAKKRQMEDEMWARFQKTHDEDLRNDLWVHYQSLVKYIAERLKAKLPECIDVNDLISAGHLGLQDAITKFDPKVGVRFETYCVPRIRGAMLDSIRASDWVPRLIRNKNHQFERLVRDLAAQLGREPSEEEIAKRMNIDLPRLDELRKELDVKAQISLEGGASDNADERDLLRLEMLDGREEEEPTRELQRDEIRDMALRGLHANERAVVEQYYFLGKSMKQIGEELQLSESRICQIHAQVLDVLRKKFRAYQDSCTF
ncbi:MAG: FliA/WhiG family RNA polymerase sigma factor [Planctomycetota bacterium]|nr:FliA/WhiG family RNA polymerase sigma factor [Planctomycetota bacterium]